MGMEADGLLSVRPRSQWMRTHVTREQYMEMAKSADWSGHEGVSVDDPELSRIPRMCKAAIEKDRGAAAEEAGYTVALLRMSSTCGAEVGIKDDLLLGLPPAKAR